MYIAYFKVLRLFLFLVIWNTKLILKTLGKPPSELEILQKQHEEKTVRIQELKKQIETAKLLLEMKKKKKNDIPDEKRQAFNNLCEKYSSMREEYHALLGERSREQK